MSLKEYIQEMGDLSSVQGLLYWDQDTHMPVQGAEARARSMTIIEREIHRKMTDPKLEELALEALESEEDLVKEAGKYWLDTYRDAKCVPESLMGELAGVASLATSAWHDSKTFEDMEGYLERLVHLSRQYTACYPAYKTYDCLIDCYEPGLTQEVIEGAFSVIKTDLLDIRANAKYRKPKRSPKASRLQLLTVSKRITEWMGFDHERGNLSETEHPFMCPLNRDDVRIAAALRAEDPIWTLKSIVHEAGHGLFEQNAEYTEYFGVDSTALHESQSLFWETMVLESPLFWDRWFNELSVMWAFKYPTAGDALADFRHNDQSNLIRLQSGNLDYGLHIMMRYELERDLFQNGMEVKDMKGRFNELCLSYLGRVPKEDRYEGVLQDSHWFAGMFGYFPSYLFGAAFAAQLWETCPRDSVETVFLHLSENVYCHGGRYSFTDVADDLGGFNPEAYLRNLRSIYT